MKSSATSARALDCGNYLPLLEGMASFDDPSASGGKSGKELPQSKAWRRHDDHSRLETR
jgi:hypothetical protein